jgi:beta-fructofuranosidase
MNDPNGLVFDGRVLHAFYQHEPVAPRWGRMHWGHATSEDLVLWHHLPIAIGPGEVGPDVFGCWSGDIVRDGDRWTMSYTGVVDQDGLRRASICQATSADGLLTWAKDPSNPVVAEPPAGIAPDLFRDPFVWREHGAWRMLVGAGTTDGLGAVLGYRAMALGDWSYAGPFLTAADLPRGSGADGPCFECPQLARVGDRDVLIISILDPSPGVRPSHVLGVVGRIDGDRFAVDAVGPIDLGPDFYAPATVLAPDGRGLLFAWVPEDPPAPTDQRGWAGALTFPRQVQLARDGLAVARIASEVSALRGPADRIPIMVVPADARPLGIAMPRGPFELLADLDPTSTDLVELDLLDAEGADPEIRVAFRPADRSLSVARRGIVVVAGRSSKESTVLPATDDGRLQLRLLVDGSVAEIEVNGDRTATVRLAGSHEHGRSVALSASGGDARVDLLAVHRLRGPEGGSAPGRRADGALAMATGGWRRGSPDGRGSDR